TIQLPSDWQTKTITPEDFENIAKMMEGFNPGLADNTHKLAEADEFQLLNLLAMDPATGRNVNIMAIPLPSDMPSDQLLPLLSTTLDNSLPGTKVLSSDSNRQINGLPAGRTAYEIAAGPFNLSGPVRGVQWYILGERLWVITTIGPVDDELIPLADRIAQTLTASKASGGSSPTAERRQVVNGGNLRQGPEVRAGNIIGQVCPGDRVVVQDGGNTPGWAAVRVEATGPDCVSERVAAGAQGWVSTSLLGPLTDNGADALPPSLPIRKLVPFTHKPTGIAGLRPDNWTIVENNLSFQISSSPAAQAGMTATFASFDEHPPEKAAAMTRASFGVFKENRVPGPPPEIHEE
ncbi:MAG: SH3 domain-containing protein, partial [Chloroflexi bacterium]|nr:SH3 domain-containing protein [Chloroflexota bacterium]